MITITIRSITDLGHAIAALEDRALSFPPRTENERNSFIGDLQTAARLADSADLTQRAAFCRAEAARLAVKSFA